MKSLILTSRSSAASCDLDLDDSGGQSSQISNCDCSEVVSNRSALERLIEEII